MSQNRLSKKAISKALSSNLVRWDVHYFPEIPSAQTYAAQVYRREGRAGVFVAANYQTVGRGRGGRIWIAPRGQALLFSFILLPGRDVSSPHFLAITVAVALCDALRSHLGLKPEVKWPNDVLLNGKKVCGILTEIVKSSEGEPGVVIGVGLNVNQQAYAFRGKLSRTATSLRIESRKLIPRIPLLSAIMRHFEDKYFLFLKGRRDEIIRQWKGYSSILGRRVSLRSGKRKVQGTVIDLEDNGAIVLRLATDSTESFFGSDCRFM